MAAGGPCRKGPRRAGLGGGARPLRALLRDAATAAAAPPDLGGRCLTVGDTTVQPGRLLLLPPARRPWVLPPSRAASLRGEPLPSGGPPGGKSGATLSPRGEQLPPPVESRSLPRALPARLIVPRPEVAPLPTAPRPPRPAQGPAEGPGHGQRPCPSIASSPPGRGGCRCLESLCRRGGDAKFSLVLSVTVLPLKHQEMALTITESCGTFGGDFAPPHTCRPIKFAPCWGNRWGKLLSHPSCEWLVKRFNFFFFPLCERPQAVVSNEVASNTVLQSLSVLGSVDGQGTKNLCGLLMSGDSRWASAPQVNTGISSVFKQNKIPWKL